VLADFTGAGTVEAYTVMYGAEGPTIGHLTGLTDAGTRFWANVEGPEVLDAMTHDEFCGKPVRVAGHLASF
jgi:hypothetical protein